MLEGVRFLRQLAQTPSLSEIIDKELLPGDHTQTDEALIDDIRNRSGTVFHPVSTCRMAPSQNDGVVNRELEVYGLSNLRVVDASVFPTMVSGQHQRANNDGSGKSGG